MDNCLLTPQAAGERLGLSPRRVLAMVREGSLAGVKMGSKHVRIPASLLDDFITAKTEEAVGSMAVANSVEARSSTSSGPGTTR